MVDFSVGVVGIGSLGFPVAKRLKTQGIPLEVADPDPSTVHAFMAEGGSHAVSTAAHLAQMCNLILLVMPSDGALHEVVTGANGIVNGLRPGAIVVDMTSTDPELGRRLSRAVVPRGGRWIEAQPVGPASAVRSGDLTLLTGGSRDIVEQARPVLEVLASRVIHLGRLGSGAIARSVGGTMTGLALAAAAEALLIARKSGLDPAGLIEALGIVAPFAGVPPSSLASDVLTGRFGSGYRLDRMLGDMDRSLDTARRNGMSVPLTALVREFAAAARHLPDGRGDHTELVRWLEGNARTELRADEPVAAPGVPEPAA